MNLRYSKDIDRKFRTVHVINDRLENVIGSASAKPFDGADLITEMNQKIKS